MHDTSGSCSALSAALSEPQAGTASVATGWLCIEQPGPWGHDALHESHLDHDLASELSARANGSGVRIVLIRRPGAHADFHHAQPRQVYLASTRPGACWLESTVLTDPKQLLDLDFHAAGAGQHVGLGSRVDESVLLVCTNGRRDVCCAVEGRPLAGALAAANPGRVWETTHTGGHRFAPTAVLLPTGYLYGRVAPSDGQRLLDSGGVVLTGNRGRSCWSRPGQVAELAVRELLEDTDPTALSVSPDGVVVTHSDGREWSVTVTEHPLPPARPTSCGKTPSVPSAFVADTVVRTR
ncbi:sucrase ferredoxin [Kutzneria sp. NPDC051319]|uniref:sucrase ferredoxin n=1 Tax=Kutzneria sp. NPDC051319 TaxID=3155047 RepID=UPI00344258C6